MRPVGARTGVRPVQLNGKQEDCRVTHVHAFADDAGLTCAAPATVGDRVFTGSACVLNHWSPESDWEGFASRIA